MDMKKIYAKPQTRIVRLEFESLICGSRDIEIPVEDEKRDGSKALSKEMFFDWDEVN